MDNLSQDCVVRLKCKHNENFYEFVIPNNTPTVDAIEVLTHFQQLLLDSLKQMQEQQQAAEAPEIDCVSEVED